jgi:ElaB/YqjD/DUF883 family membrane-anchored ribosome-binding protein
MAKAKSDPQKDKEKLAKDFRLIIKDAENLLGSLSDEMDEKAMEAKERLESSLEEARENYRELDRKLIDAAHQAEEQVEEQVKEHPMASLGVAFGVGVLLTLLVSHRKA